MLPTDQNYIPEEEIIPKKQFDLDDFMKSKSFKIAVMVILSLFIITIAISAYVYFSGINKNGSENLSPTSIVYPSPLPTKIPSKWATDSAILKEQNTLESIENDLKNLDLNEDSLTFPSVDFRVNFDKSNQ